MNALKRCLSLITSLGMLLTLVVGCAPVETPGPTGEQVTNVPQAVVALSPIFAYDDGTAAIGYNDVKNALLKDNTDATLTASQDIPWSVATAIEDGWQLRPTYSTGRWNNGAGVQARAAYAYAYSADGTVSLGSYSTTSVEVAGYNDTDKVPEFGLLWSVSGNQEEALVYTVTQDGKLRLTESVITAVQSVAGVSTGFLAEDGTARKASIRLLVNKKQVWSGTLCNSTAAVDGKAVTSLTQEEIKDIPVKAGDMVLLCLQLDAAANADEDVSVSPDEEDLYKQVLTTQRVPKDPTDRGEVDADDPLPIIFDYEPGFVILRHSKASETVLNLAKDIHSTLVTVTRADWVLRNEEQLEKDCEIVIGAFKERPESMRILKEITSYRANHAADYIVRRVGTKVYIVGGSDLALTAAVEWFKEQYCRSSYSVIPAELDEINRPSFTTLSIAGVPVGNYTIRTEKYPSLLVTKAAENIRQQVLDATGYVMPIVAYKKGDKLGKYDLRIGPMQDSLHYLPDNEKYTIHDDDAHFTIDAEGLIAGKGEGYYEAAFSGTSLIINGGSSYAISAAAELTLAALLKNKDLPKSYKLTGDYQSGATVTLDNREIYKTVDYSLSDGYGLVWAEEFNDYSGTLEEQERAFKKMWTIPDDTTRGPTVLSDDPYQPQDQITWDEQRRPGIYGENYWVWNDTDNHNGYLMQVTKKEDYGYSAGRVIGAKKWAFRYGIWETRIVVGTRNGACSALWTMGETPGSGPKNEIDLYENFGEDMFRACLHSHHSSLPQVDAEGHIGHHDNGDISHDPLYPAEGEHFYDTFHYLSIEWDCDRITMYCDGKAFDTADLTPSWMVHLRQDTTIKLAMGVGTMWYCGWLGNEKDPDNWLEDVSKFFEVQVTDNTRLYQTSNVGKKGYALNNLVFSEGYVADNK